MNRENLREGYRRARIEESRKIAEDWKAREYELTFGKRDDA